jgi:hypothetical protein
MFARVVRLTLVPAVMALLLAACGGNASVGSDANSDRGSPSPASAAIFTSDEYGFSIAYDPRFTQGEPKTEASAGRGPVYDVIFADMNGARSGDAYLDTIDVSVYELARNVTQAQVLRLSGELHDMLAQATSSLSDLKIEAPLTKLAVDGVPGYSVRYTFTDAGRPITVTAYYLFKGKHEYQITTQAASEDWAALRSKMEAAVQSFRVR